MTPLARRRAEGAVALASGTLFGLGLAVAGMTRPEKVIGFLDFFRNWDPSLAFVMGGAIAVHATSWRALKGRRSPLLATRFLVPTRRDLDARLIVGAAIFGAGWGLGGLCPGPGIASLATAAPSVALFLVAMLAGNLGAARVEPFIGRALKRG
ncbi:MAG: DUF6691 family protein [Polyangiales bacterium]